MILQATDNADPFWLTFIERLGLPLFLIFFACMCVWKLLPHIIEWFKAQTASANVVADAVPGMKTSLEKLADGKDKLDVIDERTREILSRLPSNN